MSQLGMMVIAVGLSSYNVALFHLVNHAFYKGLLFLGAGAVIHAVADNQDFRKYGGLRPFLPLTYSVMLIASLSLVAFPFMTGFYSKDFILESAYGEFYFSSIVVYFIATVGAMFTTLYSVKVLFLTFLTNPNGPVINYKHAHEGDIFMSLPLIILAIFSIFFGYITKDIFIGLGSDFFSDNSLFIHPAHEIMLDTEFAVPTLFKLLPLIFTISLSALAILFSEFLPKLLINFKLTRLGYNIFGFFNQRFFIELLYNKYVTGKVLIFGGQTTKYLDRGILEILGPYGLEKSFMNLSHVINNLNTGVVTTYALYILIGSIVYILTPSLNALDTNMFLLIVLTLLIKINPLNFNLSNDNLNKTVPLQSSMNIFNALKKFKLIKLRNVFTKKMILKSIAIGTLGAFITFVVKTIIQYFFGINIITDIFKHPIASFFGLAFSKISTMLTYIYVNLNLELLNSIRKGEIKIDITDKSTMKMGPDSKEEISNINNTKVNEVKIDGVNLMNSSNDSDRGNTPNIDTSNSSIGSPISDNAGEGPSSPRNQDKLTMSAEEVSKSLDVAKVQNSALLEEINAHLKSIAKTSGNKTGTRVNPSSSPSPNPSLNISPNLSPSVNLDNARSRSNSFSEFLNFDQNSMRSRSNSISSMSTSSEESDLEYRSNSPSPESPRSIDSIEARRMAIAETITEYKTIRANARNIDNIDLKKAEMRKAKNLYHLVRRARILDRDLARFSFRIQEINSRLRPLASAAPKVEQ
jgi:NADH-ubiquinone oxidoreductase chain 5